MQTTAITIKSLADAQAPAPVHTVEDDHLAEGFALKCGACRKCVANRDDDEWSPERYAFENGHAEARHFGPDILARIRREQRRSRHRLAN